MTVRRSIGLPITLAVVMILLLVALAVGWVLLAVFGALSERDWAPLYWTLLSVGSVFLMVVLAGVVMYLVLSIKAINLNRRQSNFMDSVTHELKSPIASLKLCLQTLSRRQVAPQERDKFHRFMLEDVERLDSLINHLLDAARLDRGTVETELEDVLLSELLVKCARSVCLRYRMGQETVQIQAEPCLVRARPVDAEMIFRNLIDNAVKYSGTPPEVKVSLQRKTDDQIVARISDNGPGIPLHLRRKIFGRFVRLGSELQRKQPGTGLGLYIVRTLVDRMHGKIRVKDADQGAGTVFEVQLPGRLADLNEDEQALERSSTKAEVA